MNSFLQKIHDLTEARVETAKKQVPIAVLEADPMYSRAPTPVRPAFQGGGYNIIAEIKFASPSEGSIHPPDDPVAIAGGYLDAGARMLSILTEPQFFKGEQSYLKKVREAHPDALLLRKDFMVEPYQLFEARACGADAILLIVGMLTPDRLQYMFDAADDLCLSALVEVHDEDEFDAALKIGARIIGVNNRNLKTLKTDLDTSRRLAKRKPHDAVFICESGLSTAEQLREMRGLGFDGFLMGTSFMKQSDPGAALQELQEQLKCA